MLAVASMYFYSILSHCGIWALARQCWPSGRPRSWGYAYPAWAPRAFLRDRRCNTHAQRWRPEIERGGGLRVEVGQPVVSCMGLSSSGCEYVGLPLSLGGPGLVAGCCAGGRPQGLPSGVHIALPPGLGEGCTVSRPLLTGIRRLGSPPGVVPGGVTTLPTGVSHWEGEGGGFQLSASCCWKESPPLYSC